MCFKKKAILMIHGFVGGIYDYNNFQNELQLNRQFDVFVFTLPGHEKTTVKDVKYEDWINEAKRQIEILINHKYKKIYVIGHSMGGVIATYLASAYPQVKKLVLVAPAFRYFYFTDGKVNIKGFNETIKGMPELFKNMGTEKVLERIQKTPIPTMIEFTKVVSNHEHDVEKVTCPVLTIHGLEDKVVPIEGTDFVYNNVKSKSNTLINMKSLTHDCFNRDRKDEVKKIITDFLKKKPKAKKITLNI